MPLEAIVGLVVLVALAVYMLTGGADFGGGAWDLFASGPRARAQRNLVEHAIAPIWEANHVWLIVVVVVLFVCFPVVFAALATALHVPLTLMLVGIVLRGSAFVFRAYDPAVRADAATGWQRVFAVASVLTPLMLGVCLGAVAAGRVRVDPATGEVRTGFVEAWLAPFPFALGAFVVALCALLAAVYLTRETDDPALQDDFRFRGLASGLVAGVLAFVCLALARRGAPGLWEGLTARAWSLPFQLVTGALAVGVLAALWRRRYVLARLLVGGQVLAVVAGFGGATWPYVLPPDLTLAAAAAPPQVLAPVLWVLALGAIPLLPAFGWLYVVFKGGRAAP